MRSHCHRISFCPFPSVRSHCVLPSIACHETWLSLCLHATGDNHHPEDQRTRAARRPRPLVPALTAPWLACSSRAHQWAAVPRGCSRRPAAGDRLRPPAWTDARCRARNRRGDVRSSSRKAEFSLHPRHRLSRPTHHQLSNLLCKMSGRLAVKLAHAGALLCHAHVRLDLAVLSAMDASLEASSDFHCCTSAFMLFPSCAPGVGRRFVGSCNLQRQAHLRQPRVLQRLQAGLSSMPIHWRPSAWAT